MAGSQGAGAGLEPRRERDDGGLQPLTQATVELPVTEFVLEETLRRLPSATFACESAVPCGGAAMPLVRASGAGRPELEGALAGDVSVERASIVERRDDGLLCHVRWRDRALFDLLASGAAVFRNVRGSADGWSLEILYPSRNDLSEAYSVWDACDVDVDLRSVRDLAGGSEGEFGLTASQRDALAGAHEAGYFEVPREADLDEVAADLGITHQSLSERLRRAHDALVEHTVLERDR